MLDRTKAPAVSAIADLALPEISEETLSNGIVLRVLSSGSQDVNQLLLAFPGSANEARSWAVARLAASMMREGTKSLSNKALAEKIDYRGALVKTECREHYTILSAVSLNSMVDGLLPLLSDIILSPAYDEATLKIFKEREAKELLQNESKVKEMCTRALFPLIMGRDNPLARIKTVEDVERATRDEIADFQHRIVRSTGCQAFLCGKITDKILDETKNMLESLPQNLPPVDLQIMPFHADPPQSVFVQKPGALQSAIQAALPAIPRSNPEYIPLRFTVQALGGYFGSRLMKNIREEKGYTYGIRSMLLGWREGSFILIGAEADNRYVEPLIEEIRNELRKLATDPIGPEEMQRLKQSIALTLMETLDSPFNIMDFYKSRFLVGFPADYFEQQVRWVKNLSAETIMEIAHKYLNPDELRIAVAGA